MAFLFFGENNMFTEELNYIEEARIREAAKVLLDNLPDILRVVIRINYLIVLLFLLLM